MTTRDTTEIDIAAALARVGGNRAVLDRVLKKFARNHGGAADQIRAALESGDRAAARRIAHSIKGVSGNIGANPLHRAGQEEHHGQRSQESEISTGPV